MKRIKIRKIKSMFRLFKRQMKEHKGIIVHKLRFPKKNLKYLLMLKKGGINYGYECNGFMCNPRMYGRI